MENAWNGGHHLSAVLDAIADHIAILDEKGIIRRVNASWRRFAEANGAEPAAVGEGVDYLAAGAEESEDAARAGAGIRSVLAGERPLFSIEYTCHSENERRWFIMRATPLSGEDGGQRRVAGAVICHHEITELKRGQEQLHFHSQLLDSVRESVIATDLDGKVIYWNTGAEALYGHPRKAVIGKPVTLIVPPEETERELNRIETVLREGAWSGQYIQRRSDGATFWADTHISMILDERGAAMGMIGIDRDISETKLNEIKYRQIFEASPVSLWEEGFGEVKREIDRLKEQGVADFRRYFKDHPERLADMIRKVRVIDVNQATLDLYGARSKEEFRNGIADVLGEEAYPDFIEGLALIAAGGRRLRAEKVHRTLSGERLDVQLRWHVAPGCEKTYERVLVCIVDMTAEKAAARERQRLEERLRQSWKMETIGTLAGGVAHDFNNILSIVLGNAEIAMDDLSAWHPSYRYLKNIEQASLRAKEIIRALLAYARKTDERKQVIRIDSVVADSLKLVRASLPATIGIDSHIRLDMPHVHAHPAHINQILMNLSANAAQAMPRREGVIRVELTNAAPGPEVAMEGREPASGPFVRLSVSDTGEGIASENMGRIFDPYFTTRDVGQGSGMGLSVAQGIARALNGEITVASRPGEGARFDIWLPVAAAAETTAETGAPDAGMGRILVVDDERQLLELITHMLESLGYQAVCESNPVEALQRFKADPYGFAAVISDMTMPEMNGLDLGVALLRVRPDCPVILCTGHNNLLVASDALAAGMAAFMMKPFTRRELAATLRRAIPAQT